MANEYKPNVIRSEQLTSVESSLAGLRANQETGEVAVAPAAARGLGGGVWGRGGS